jgi:hypothetical protein
MLTAETSNFAALCSAPHTKTTRWPYQFLALQPAICWSVASSDVTLGIRRHGIPCTPMSLAASAKALAQGRPPITNLLPVPTHSFASTTTTFQCTRGRKYATPWFLVKSNQKRTTLTAHESPLVASASAILAMWVPTQHPWNYSSFSSTVYSRKKDACFSSINLKNFYLDTPMPKPEYICIKISVIPQEFINEYKLTGLDHAGWIYFKIRQGCYGLSKADILANNLLQSCLEAKGFYEVASTPGLWHHKWRPIQFCLIIDNFGIEYVGLEHFTYLLDILKKFHGVQYNMAGNKFAGMDIKWNCASCHCCISMPGYISLLLLKYKHLQPAKPRLSPYKCLPIAYGANLHITPNTDASELLNANRKRCIQEIVGSLHY